MKTENPEQRDPPLHPGGAEGTVRLIESHPRGKGQWKPSSVDKPQYSLQIFLAVWESPIAAGSAGRVVSQTELEGTL